MKQTLEYIAKVEEQIKDLNKILSTDALKVKNEIENIIINIEKQNVLKGDLLKLELIKTKIEALTKLGGLKEIINDLKKAENFIFNEFIISLDKKIEEEQKKEILKELYIQVLDSINENTYTIYNQDWTIDNNKKKEYLEYINLIIEKLSKIDVHWIWEYYKWLFYSTLWDNDNFIKYNKEAALSGENKESVIIYVSQQLNNFLEKYDSLNSQEEKKEFLNKNLENLEEDIFQFVDEFQINENWNRIKLKQWWHKELYWIIWDFYKNIWLYSDALSSYISWTQSKFNWNYKLYKKIAEIYENSNIILETKKYKKEKIKKTYEILYQLAYINNDPENVFYWLEKVASLSDSQREKYKKLWQIVYMFELNYSKYSSNDKLILSYIRACNNINSKILNEHSLYLNLTYIDTKYIWLYANYLEEKWELSLAFINYITNYTLEENQDNLDAIVIFIYDKVISKIQNEIQEYNKKILDLKETIKNKELNITKKHQIKFEIKILKSNIKILLKEQENLKKQLIEIKEITDEDIKEFFRLTLTNQELENINYQNVKTFFDYYNQDLPKAEIYLKTILEQIQILYWYKKEILKPYFDKIKKEEAFTQDDLDDFKDIIESKNLYTILENINEEELDRENEQLQKEIDLILKKIKEKEKKKK